MRCPSYNRLAYARAGSRYAQKNGLQYFSTSRVWCNVRTTIVCSLALQNAVLTPDTCDNPM